MPNHVKIRPLAAERKLSRGLFDQLAEQIKSGRLAPGARLPTEQALTRAARVSRTVVREAVAALRAEGLVVTRQGVGAFVSAAPQHAPFRIEPERMQTLADILNVMELRLGVEIESAGIAAELHRAVHLDADASLGRFVELLAHALDGDHRRVAGRVHVGGLPDGFLLRDDGGGQRAQAGGRDGGAQDAAAE